MIDYLAYLLCCQPEGKDDWAELASHWPDGDISQQVGEASRDCERWAPILSYGFARMIVLLGFSQGFAKAAATKFHLTMLQEFGVQLCVILAVAFGYSVYFSARRPGRERFLEVVGELSLVQLEDLSFDPQLGWMANLELKKRIREAGGVGS